MGTVQPTKPGTRNFLSYFDLEYAFIGLRRHTKWSKKYGLVAGNAES